MIPFDKIRGRLVVGFAVVGLFFVLMMLFVPRLVNLETVKKRIISHVSSTTGGELVYRQLELRWFPQPRVVIHTASLTLPGNQYFSFFSLKIYPKILPLLIGRVQFKRIEAVEPQIRFRPLHENQSESIENKGQGSIQRLMDRMIGILAEPIMLDPDLVYIVNNGSIDVLTAAPIDLKFRNVNAHLRYTNNRLRLKISCESNIGKEIVMSAWARPDRQFGKGRLHIKQFHPHLLTRVFLPEPPFQATDSAMNLEVGFQADSSRHVQADLKLSGILFRMENNADVAEIDGGTARVAIRATPQNTTVSLSEFLFDTPQMDVSGHLFIDHARPAVGLELSGIDIHIDALRKVARVMAGGNRSIQNVFGIITGGRIPIVTVSGRGRSLADLGRIENVTVKGAMAEGRISIPGPDLHLQNVRGNATISEGMLRCDQVQAQLDDSHGTNGEMTLGLLGPASPFHLEIDTLADVAQLQRVLVRLVNHEKFREELTRITRVTGKAQGRLIIGDRLDSLHISAKVSEAHIQADYDRIALPIEISGGTYELARNSFTAGNFDAKIGKSSFTGISGEWGWDPESRFRVAARKSRIELDELYRWLTRFERLEKALRTVRVTQGTAELATLTVTNGDAETPEYRFNVAGIVSQARIEDGLTPAALSLNIPKVEFTARSNTANKVEIDLTGKQIRWGQSRLDVTGTTQLADGYVHLDLDVSADQLTWTQLNAIGRNRRMSAPPENLWGRRLQGGIRIDTAAFSYGAWDWQSVVAEVRFAPVSTTVTILRAELCGIPFPGEIRITPRGVAFDFAPLAGDKDLEPAFACLWNRDGMVTGRYSLSGSLTSETTEPEPIRSLKGNLDLKAHSGRIYRYGILSKVLALLNLTEIFRGKLPDIVNSGFAYETIKARGEFEGGKFILKDGIINGASMTIVYRGTFNLVDETLNMSILVAPFKTIDNIIRNIPLVNNFLGGRSISIPFAVTGKWSDYTVIPLSTTAKARNAPLTIEN